MRSVRLVDVICIFALFFLVFRLIPDKGNESVSSEILSDGNSKIIKTVAHIDLSGDTDMQLIHSDADSDVAYYEYTGDRPTLGIGDLVYFYDGTSSNVIATDIQGFTLSSNPSVTFGYSGTAVINSAGVQVGYVSERTENGYIRCIWV